MRNFRTNEHQPGRIGQNLVYLPQFNNDSSFTYFFMSIGMNAFEQNFQLNHFDCENDFAFRKSACNMQPPENQNKF